MPPTSWSLTVWADSRDVPAMTCANARLGGAASHPANPNGQTNGQGGWDIGLRFMNLTDLAGQLEQLQKTLPWHMCNHLSWPPKWTCPGIGKVTQLAINAHGIPGTLYTGGSPDGTKVFDPRAEHFAISVENLRAVAGDLLRIRDAMDLGATVFLMGCLAGQGQDGTDMLKVLSQCWPGRRIVAFTTVGFQDADLMLRDGKFCTEPGMRDTQAVNQSPPGLAPWGEETMWKNLNMLPWASETSPGAKIALNGQIIRQPAIDVAPAAQPSQPARHAVKRRPQHVTP
jgi:hypothetical protein